MFISDSDPNDNERDNERLTQFFAEVTAVAHSVSALHKQIFVSLEPQGEQVVKTKSEDVAELESLKSEPRENARFQGKLTLSLIHI